MPPWLTWETVKAQYARLPIVPTKESVATGTYIIIGANTGLGYECAKHFVQLGAHRVVLGCRSNSRGEAALATIRKATGRKTAGEVWEVDLGSLDSVERFSKRLQTIDRIDALVCNASIAMMKYTSIDSVESSIMVNNIGTFLLTLRALPKLKESAAKFMIQPHIVVVSSGLGLYVDGALDSTKMKGNIYDELSTEDTDMSERLLPHARFLFISPLDPDYYQLLSEHWLKISLPFRYAVTKALQILTVRELALILPVSQTGVVINVLSPGLCSTELDRNGTFRERLPIIIGRLLMGRTAEAGSRTLLHAAVAGIESHGTYVSDCQIKDTQIPLWMKNEDGSRLQKRVWNDLLQKLQLLGHPVDTKTLETK